MQEEFINKYIKYFNKLLKIDDTQSGGNSAQNIELTITDGARTFKIYGKDILDLELKLNLSPYGTAWKSLGTYLHNFYIGTTGYQSLPSTLYITTIQWDYLNSLKNSLNNIYSYPVTTNIYYNKTKSSSILITDGSTTLFVDGAFVSDLLAKLNYTVYAYKWTNIITALRNCSLNISPTELRVTTEQLIVLRSLYLRNMPSVINQYNMNLSGVINSSDMTSPDVWDEHPRLNGSKIIFSDGEDSLTVRGEDIYKLYKKIKNSKYSKKFKKIRKSILTIQPYSTIPILVDRNELEILSMIKKNSEEYIELHYPKEKKEYNDEKKDDVKEKTKRKKSKKESEENIKKEN